MNVQNDYIIKYNKILKCSKLVFVIIIIRFVPYIIIKESNIIPSHHMHFTSCVVAKFVQFLLLNSLTPVPSFDQFLPSSSSFLCGPAPYLGENPGSFLYSVNLLIKARWQLLCGEIGTSCNFSNWNTNCWPRVRWWIKWDTGEIQLTFLSGQNPGCKWKHWGSPLLLNSEYTQSTKSEVVIDLAESEGILQPLSGEILAAILSIFQPLEHKLFSHRPTFMIQLWWSNFWVILFQPLFRSEPWMQVETLRIISVFLAQWTPRVHKVWSSNGPRHFLRILLFSL